MSFAIPTVAAASLCAFTAWSWDLKRQAEARLIAEANNQFDTKMPEEGIWRPASDRWGADNLRFKSVLETTDVDGSRIFLVDYGQGSRVKQYNDPRVYLGN